MGLSSEEHGLIAQMESQLSKYVKKNKQKTTYYEGDAKPHNVGFSVPPLMRDQAPRMGWAGTIVDALEERIQLLGWHDPSGELGLDAVFNQNLLEVESGLIHLDSLMYGIGFVKIGVGGEGEPDPLVTMESAMHTTGIMDHRTRLLSSAITLDPIEKGSDQTGALYLKNATVRIVKRDHDWVEESRDTHHLGRIPVVALPNRTSASVIGGHSEISAPVRDLVDEASRVLLAMAVNREFFSMPQRLVLGVKPEDIDGWQAVMSSFFTIEPDAKGALPQVVDLKQVSPGPHIDQLKALASQLATVTGVPDAYFGVTPTANPSSADAIRASEVRLIKKAERRCQMFGRGWLEVARLAVLFAKGAVPEEFADVSVWWADPATPTQAARADEVAKLVGAGILPPRSEETYSRINLTRAQQDQVEADWERAKNFGDMLGDVIDHEAPPNSPVAVSDEQVEEAIKDKANALGVLIRAGVDPREAADRVGLPGLVFSHGLMPTTLKRTDE